MYKSALRVCIVYLRSLLMVTVAVSESCSGQRKMKIQVALMVAQFTHTSSLLITWRPSPPTATTQHHSPPLISW